MGRGPATLIKNEGHQRGKTLWKKISHDTAKEIMAILVALRACRRRQARDRPVGVWQGSVKQRLPLMLGVRGW